MTDLDATPTSPPDGLRTDGPPDPTVRFPVASDRSPDGRTDGPADGSPSGPDGQRTDGHHAVRDLWAGLSVLYGRNRAWRTEHPDAALARLYLAHGPSARKDLFKDMDGYNAAVRLMADEVRTGAVRPVNRPGRLEWTLAGLGVAAAVLWVLWSTWGWLGPTAAIAGSLVVVSAYGRRTVYRTAGLDRPSATWSGPDGPSDGPTVRPGERGDEVVRAVTRIVANKVDKPEDGSDAEPVRLLSATREPNGWSYALRLPDGPMADDVLKERRRLAGRLDVPEACLLLEFGDTPRRMTLWMADRDPLRSEAPETSLVDIDSLSLWEHFEIGTSIRGLRVLANLIGYHLLVSGASNSGKTFLALLIALGVAKDPNATAVICDPQGLGAWSPFAGLADVVDGPTDDDIRRMCEKLEYLAGTVFEARRAEVERLTIASRYQNAQAKVTRGMTTNAEVNLPLLFVILDECHRLFGHPIYGDRILAACKTLVSRGRALGITLIGITQKASGKNIDTDVRDLFESRACFKVTTTEMADMALGDGWAAAGMNPLALQLPIHQGVCYLRGPILHAPRGISDWVLMKTDNVDVNQVRRVVDECVAMRRNARPALLTEHGPIFPASAAVGLAPAATAVARPATRPCAAEIPLVERFEHLVDAMAGDQWAYSEEIIANLQDAHPDLYGHLRPVRGKASLNAWLEPLGLATHNVGPDNRKGLMLHEVLSAQAEYHAGREAEPGAASGAETDDDVSAPIPLDSAPSFRSPADQAFPTYPAERAETEGEDLDPSECLAGRIIGWPGLSRSDSAPHHEE